MPIGGAEDRTREPRVLKRFLELCGRKPRIAVIPTASGRRETGSEYATVLHDLGAIQVDVLIINEREDCLEDDKLDRISAADGVFLTGGNQLRLSTILGGTPVAKLLRRRNADGMPIGGTSAGAAIMPEHMIASGDEGSSPREGMVTLAPGLGFTNKVMIDQHFRQRDRLGRLLTAVAYNPFAVGVGIDEDTAVIIRADNTMEVVGTGSVTVIDPSKLQNSSIVDAERGAPVSLIDLRLHLLIHGGRFDLDRREAFA